MQLIYAPFNIYKWCVKQGYLPKDASVVFGLQEDIMEEPRDTGKVCLVVDLLAQGYKQAYQMFASLATYRVFADGKLLGDEASQAVTAQTDAYLTRWLEFGNGSGEGVDGTCRVEDDGFIHPVVGYLKQVVINKGLLEEDFVFLGDGSEKINDAIVNDVELRSFNISAAIFVDQLTQIRDVVCSEIGYELEDGIWEQFLLEWKIISSMHDSFGIPNAEQLRECCIVGKKEAVIG